LIEEYVLEVSKVNEDCKLPTRAHEDDAGLDLYCREGVNLRPGEVIVVPVGINIAVPKGCVGLVWPRSGLAKKGVDTMAGVIDSGFRGELCVMLINHSQERLWLEKETRVAQLIVQPLTQMTVSEVETLDKTQRGEDGFGSSGQ
jgi:dUTP pyrophosphatase